MQPTNIPAESPYRPRKICPDTCPSGICICKNTETIFPRIPPRMIACSKQSVPAARLHYPIIRGTTPMTITNANVPAATAPPNAIPKNPSRI